MTTESAKLTIRLPREDLEFAKAYAKANRMTVTEVIDRHLRHMRTLNEGALSPELDVISGIIPRDVAAEREYADYLALKHQ